jgi:hypothetical protein
MIGFLSDRYDVGIEFVDPPADFLRALEEYLEHAPPSQKDQG